MKVILIATLIFGFSGLVLAKENSELVVCTMDAKPCPDGSYVSRAGANCEFTTCPKSISGKEELIDTVIIGSAETPDPVSERVFELEKKGVVSSVTIMESFPVQIRLKATQQIIDELKAIPRIISPTFK